MSTSTSGDCRDPETKAAADNHSDQCNPNNPKYQGHEKGYPGKGDKADLDHHSKQLNPNNSHYQPKK